MLDKQIHIVQLIMCRLCNKASAKDNDELEQFSNQDEDYRRFVGEMADSQKVIEKVKLFQSIDTQAALARVHAKMESST